MSDAVVFRVAFLVIFIWFWLLTTFPLGLTFARRRFQRASGVRKCSCRSLIHEGCDMATRTIRVTVRLSKDEARHVSEVAKERGFLSPSAFIREAIRNEITGRDGDLTEAEQRLAATMERLSRDVSRGNRGQQALFAVVDTLVKTFLTCVPEPQHEGMVQSIARARDRYARFIKSAGQAMVGDSQTAMHDLVNREE